MPVMWGRLQRLVMTGVGLLVLSAVETVVGDDELSFTQVSEPALFFEYAGRFPAGSAVQTTNAPQLIQGFRFAYWEFNGIEQRDQFDHALNPVHTRILAPIDATAYYLESDADTNTNSLPDWWELNWHTGLVHSAGSDREGDGWDAAAEYFRDYHPGLTDRLADGGVSLLDGDAGLVILNTNLAHVSISSLPGGLVTEGIFVTNRMSGVLLPETYVVDGMRFCYWTLNGTAQTDLTGRAYAGMSFVLRSNTVARAQFVDEDEDADGDRVADWYEYHFLGGLGAGAGVDGDLDGFDLRMEYLRDYHAGLVDRLRDGGVCVMDGEGLQVILNTNLAQVTVSSEPAGLVPDLAVVSNKSSLMELPDVYVSGDMHFGYWIVNGTVQRDALGRAFGGMRFQLEQNTDATAFFVDINADSDADGCADWYEIHFAGGLDADPADDQDGDGFDLRREYLRDYHAGLVDRLRDGGVSIMDSGSRVVMLDTNYVQVDVASVPGDLVTTRSYVTNRYASVVLPDVYVSDGMHFCYWRINGIRQVDQTGRAYGGMTRVLASNTTAEAFFVPEAEDSDLDGVPDWYEWHFHGGLSENPAFDPDGDGFDMAAEYTRDYHAGVADRLRDGGISILDSDAVSVDLAFFPRQTQSLFDGLPVDFYSASPPATGMFAVAANSHPALGDWDGDGDLDLFVGGSNGVMRVFENRGSPVVMNWVERTSNFAAIASCWTNIASPAPALGDWSGDGKADLAVGGSTNELWLVESPGSFATNALAGATTTPFVVAPSGAVPAFGDINTDGHTDLLVLTTNGTVTVYTNTANPSLPYSTPPFSSNLLGDEVPGGRGITVSDVNGDGVPDVLISDDNGNIWEFHGQ